MIAAISKYLADKLLEWTMACIALSIGIEILIWPSTLHYSAFRYMINWFDPVTTGTIYAAVGATRIVSLVVNGRSWVYGPRARAVGAVLTAVLWAQMEFALLMLLPDNPPSIGIPNWFFLSLAEIIVAYRAATNVKRRN